MKALLKYILLISLLSLLIKCDKDEITSRNYPRLKTLPVSEITKEGAIFNAEIIFRGDFEIINYGFVWAESENPIISNSERVIYSDNIQSNNYSETIETTLKEDISYFVRAFVETKDYIVYGENMSFLSLGSKAPKIQDIFPLEGTIGDTLKIIGENFSYVNKTNEVFFNEVKTQALYSSDSLIIVLVPVITDANNIISISIEGNSSMFSDAFITTTPKFNSINPVIVAFGDTIEIDGDYFSYSNTSNKVLIGNTEANVIMSSKKILKVIVPSDLEKSTNMLSLKIAGKEAKFESIFIKPPMIWSINNEIIQTFNNENLKISGEYFNPLPEKNSVSFGDQHATVVSSSNNQLIVEFPRSLIPKIELSVFDTLDVKVTVLDQNSVLEKSLIIDYKSTWTQMRDFPGNPRIFGACFSLNDKGYIGLGGGGEFDNWYKDFWEYDPVNDMWTRLEDFPGTARSKFSTFVIGNDAYIICGTIGNQYTESNNLSEVWKFNGVSHTWTQMNDFPGGARWSPFGFSIGNIGFFGGGVYGNYTSQKDFWQYNPNNDLWSQLDNIPNNIWEEDLFAISDSEFGYLLADYCGSPCNKRYFWKYTPSTKVWQSIESMPGPYRETTGFNINNRFYIGTGVFSSWTGTSAFYSYNPNLNEWTNMPFFVESRRTASSFAINDFGYLLLGKSGSHSANKNDVWKFDPSKTD